MDELSRTRALADHDRPGRCSCLLRLEAEKFGAAEYYEATRDGERPRSAGGWPGTRSGSPIVIAILFVHPTPQPTCSSDRATGSGRWSAACATACSASLVAVGLRDLRYRRIRFPDVVVVSRARC